MPSHASTAAKVRAEKERHPERFCPDCLWRTGDGSYCPRHVPSPPTTLNAHILRGKVPAEKVN